MEKDFEERISDQFDSFDQLLRSNMDGLEIFQRVCDYRDLKAENDRIQVSIDRLQLELEKWKTVEGFLEATVVGSGGGDGCSRGEDTNNNEFQHEAQKQLLSVEYFDDNLSLLILDNLAKELAATSRNEDQAEDGGTPNTTAAKSIVRKASDVTFKAGKKTKMQRLASGPPVTTRRRRLLKGSALTNPFKYPNCLLCKGGFYREAELRAHYKRRHSLDFGDAPLPTSDIQIVCLEKDRQTSNRCSICKAQFKTLQEVMVHKSNNHINEKFKRYSCDHCGLRFVLAKELKTHLLLHSM